MHHHYDDIISRIPEPPKWWDEYAVPRYITFGPDETADIYADQCALIEIECQGCGALFLVAWSQSRITWGRNEDGTAWARDAKPFDPQMYHYGDPPNSGCCAAGPTMNSIPRRVMEFWKRHDPKYTGPKDGHNVVLDMKYFDWVRVPELEVEIKCEWADERS